MAAVFRIYLRKAEHFAIREFSAYFYRYFI